jgi:hypothetical protein
MNPTETLREIHECYERAALGFAVHRNVARAKMLEQRLREHYLAAIIDSFVKERTAPPRKPS